MNKLRRTLLFAIGLAVLASLVFLFIAWEVSSWDQVAWRVIATGTGAAILVSSAITVRVTKLTIEMFKLQDEEKLRLEDSFRSEFASLDARVDDLLAEINIAKGLVQDLSKKMDGKNSRLEDSFRSEFASLDARVDDLLAEINIDRSLNPRQAADVIGEIHSALNMLHAWPQKPGRIPLNRWSASITIISDFVEQIENNRPGLVLELGSGLSTLAFGKSLLDNQIGRLIALEHSADFRELHIKALSELGLENIVSLVDAPLMRYLIDDVEYDWYKIPHLEPKSVDMVFVDGPPGVATPLARYPAVPLLDKFLADYCYVYLDDSNRADEMQTLALWTENPNYKIIRKYEGLKPYVVLQKIPESVDDHHIR